MVEQSPSALWGVDAIPDPPPEPAIQQAPDTIESVAPDPALAPDPAAADGPLPPQEAEPVPGTDAGSEGVVQADSSPQSVG